MKMKVLLLTIISLITICSQTLKSETWTVDDYLQINDGDIYDGEIFVINDGVVDVYGGDIGKLTTSYNSSANIYGGYIEWLDGRGDSIISIHGGEIGPAALNAYNNNIVNLYAYNVAFHPENEAGKSWIEGIYYSDDNYFTIPVWDQSAFSHVNIVPEPFSFLLLSLGGIILANRNRK